VQERMPQGEGGPGMSQDLPDRQEDGHGGVQGRYQSDASDVLAVRRVRRLASSG